MHLIRSLAIYELLDPRAGEFSFFQKPKPRLQLQKYFGEDIESFEQNYFSDIAANFQTEVYFCYTERGTFTYSRKYVYEDKQHKTHQYLLVIIANKDLNICARNQEYTELLCYLHNFKYAMHLAADEKDRMLEDMLLNPLGYINNKSPAFKNTAIANIKSELAEIYASLAKSVGLLVKRGEALECGSLKTHRLAERSVDWKTAAYEVQKSCCAKQF